MDKDLPPTPPSQILAAKTLKRKNFKQLLLAADGPLKDGLLDSNRRNRGPEGLEPIVSNQLINQMGTLDLNGARSGSLGSITKLNGNGLVNSLSVAGNHSVNNVNNIIISGSGGGSAHSSIHLSSSSSGVIKTTIVKKRQTVILLISPTRSISSIPLLASSILLGQKLSFTDLLTADEFVSSPLLTTSHFKLNNKDLVTLKFLGSGNSGSVLKILHVPSKKIMAKKIINIDLKMAIQTQIIRELRILHECHLPFIIEFYGAFINNSNAIVICVEYCNCGLLDKIINLCENRQFPTFVMKRLCHLMVSGMTYLHNTHKIIHRDIKPSNVLMTHKGEFKLCDFGVSTELANLLAKADTFVGTSAYMSPERIQGLHHGLKLDVWLMGLMLMELALGSKLWSDNYGSETETGQDNGPEGILDLLQRIVNEEPPTLTGKINKVTGEPYDKYLCSLIDRCLLKDENSRPLPWDILEDPFVQDNDKLDKEVKAWAKTIRKIHKQNNEQQ